MSNKASTLPKKIVNPATPLEAFLDILGMSFFAELVEETNRYALQCQAKNRQKDSSWSATNEPEIKAFLGVLILMALMKRPNQDSYWEECWCSSVIPQVFPKNRFEKLLQYLHLNDREKRDSDPFFQVRPLITTLEISFARQPVEASVVIDEGMAPFTGRSSYITYMPKKPHPWGTKFWLLVNCSNKLVVRFQGYSGKIEGKREVGLGHRVVLDLLTSEHLGPEFTLLTSGRKLYIDRYFNSPTLCKELSQSEVKVIGTCMTNRVGYPKIKGQVKKNQGEWSSAALAGLVAVVWFDKKKVNFLTNDADLLVDSQVPRRQKNGERKLISCPEVVKDYGSHMGAVDVHDHLRESYSIARTSHKWWMSVFYFLIDMALTNAFVGHNLVHHVGNRITHLKFMESVGLGLVGSFTARQKRGTPAKKSFSGR